MFRMLSGNEGFGIIIPESNLIGADGIRAWQEACESRRLTFKVTSKYI
jgi:hypothetical protein